MAVRYDTAVPIGRGASGEVFKAWDPVAGRPVALKLFPPDSGDSARRREREAAAQAGLDHPCICEIYEVGTNDAGHGFIAMRYVDGEPLDEVVRRLPLEQRVRLVAQIADAVAAAHDAGLIHRDLKPSNLLVEEQADGELLPFVLDFGIVRVSGQSRLTETGQVLGTPGYLSPEQAIGDEDIDPRSDVFSLGAILYQALTGEAPFAATSEVGALMRVLEHEPPLAQVRCPDLPAELGHIAAKAMEKDPRRRYPNARAFYRDLDRFLQARQVLARPVGWAGRLLRQAERNPRLWFAGVFLLLLALGSLTWGLRNRLVVQSQTREAESFARRSAAIEAQLRFAELLPKHSIAGQRQALASATEHLAVEVAASHGRARAAGEYAVGRALLSLGEPERAAFSLRRARSRGFADSAGSLALALALLEEARQDLRLVDFVRDPEVRRAERVRLRQELRREALPLVREAAGASPIDAGEQLLAQALSAFLMDRFEASRRLSSGLIETWPWMIEADLLLADTFREEARRARSAEDYDGSSEALASERQALAKALERASSSPILYERLCESHLVQAQLELAERSAQAVWEASFAAAEAACAAAQEVLPESSNSASLQVEIGWRRLLQRLRWNGVESVADDAKRIVEAARRRYDQSAGPVETRNLGNALYAQAEVLRELGEPSLEVLEQASAALEAGLEQAPGLALGWQSLGHVWARHGLAMDAKGQDPRPSFRRALEVYQRGLSGSGVQQSRIYNGVCMVQSEFAYYGLQHREQATANEVAAAIESAVHACEAALARDPAYLSALSNLGLVHWTEAEWLISRDRDPRAAADRGRQRFGELLELAPEHLSARNNLVGMNAAVGRWQLDSGATEQWPELRTLLEESIATTEPLMQLIPADASLHLARLKILSAALSCRQQVGDQGALSQLAWQEALAAVEALAESAPAVQSKLRWAAFHRRRAECARLAGDSGAANSEIARGLKAVESALALDPTLADALTEQAKLQQIAGQRAG